MAKVWDVCVLGWPGAAAQGANDGGNFFGLLARNMVLHFVPEHQYCWNTEKGLGV
jgi:hypothetical protein